MRALPIKPGYWRSSLTCVIIRECLNPVGDGHGSGMKSDFIEPSFSNHFAIPTYSVSLSREHRKLSTEMFVILRR